MTGTDYMENPIHEHKLKLEPTNIPYTCDGCNQKGVGLCYRCHICNYDLHRHCATASLQLYGHHANNRPTDPPSANHTFYPKFPLNFHLSPIQNRVRRCDACGKDVAGFVYQCSKHNIDLHPSCVNLPMMLDLDGGEKVFLHKKMSKTCIKCGKKDKQGWSYRPTDEGCQLHVGCARDMIEDEWDVVFEQSQNGMLQLRVSNINRMLQARDHRRSGDRREFIRFAWKALLAVVRVLLGDHTYLVGWFINNS